MSGLTTQHYVVLHSTIVSQHGSLTLQKSIAPYLVYIVSYFHYIVLCSASQCSPDQVLPTKSTINLTVIVCSYVQDIKSKTNIFHYIILLYIQFTPITTLISSYLSINETSSAMSGFFPCQSIANMPSAHSAHSAHSAPQRQQSSMQHYRAFTPFIFQEPLHGITGMAFLRAHFDLFLRS